MLHDSQRKTATSEIILRRMERNTEQNPKNISYIAAHMLLLLCADLCVFPVSKEHKSYRKR